MLCSLLLFEFYLPKVLEWPFSVEEIKVKKLQLEESCHNKRHMMERNNELWNSNQESSQHPGIYRIGDEKRKEHLGERLGGSNLTVVAIRLCQY